MPGRSLDQLRVFLGATFVITWTCWWGLAYLAGHDVTTYGDTTFMVAYALGGLGPTIAAYGALVTTDRKGALREVRQRLLRWRVNAAWYAAALGLPFVLALGTMWAGAVLTTESGPQAAPETWLRLVVLFPRMVLGGGLEELGWRGVAQPELERLTGRLRATAAVGAIWALWHLPLFFVAGAPQYGQTIPVFAVEVVGSAFLLAWLYDGTGSLLLCVLFHAAQNTAAVTYGLQPNQAGVRWGAAILKLALGVVLMAASKSSLRPGRSDA